jgi:hypothetical protein
MLTSMLLRLGMIQRMPKTVYVNPQQLKRQREHRDEARNLSSQIPILHVFLRRRGGLASWRHRQRRPASPKVTTRCLILEKADYRVFPAQTFGNAMLVLINHQIDIVVLCQSLKDEERRGILETARALQPEIKCAVLNFEELEGKLNGVDLIQGLEGPTALLSAIGKLLTQRVTRQTQASN